MSSSKREMQLRRVTERRQEREVQKHRKELERRAKERAKLSALEDAKLQVEMFENAVEVLLSIHKDCCPAVHWGEFATTLRPHSPVPTGSGEFAVELQRQVAEIARLPEVSSTNLTQARIRDEREHAAELQKHQQDVTEWMQTRALAKGVLQGEAPAYSEAVARFSCLSDLTGLRSAVQIIVHSRRVVSCTLTVSGRDVVPPEAKSLTPSGKLSVKKMPKGRFHEIYHDYVCGCVLRVARELFALLPLETVIVTASVENDSEVEQTGQVFPVLSIVAERAKFESLDFENADASETVETLAHRGDMKLSRKTGQFVGIEPLTLADLRQPSALKDDFGSLLSRLERLRAEVRALLRSSPDLDLREERSPSI